MGRIWVLDTETKGTGAEMVPLERALEAKRAAPKDQRIEVIRRRPRPQAPEAADPAPEPTAARSRRYRVVNAISGQTLVEDAGAREALTLLEGMRSMVDARVYVREDDEAEWQPLTLREQKALWAFRKR
jgi:hypothetical protein